MTSTKRTLFAASCCLVIAGQVVAEGLDPHAMRTHCLDAKVSFYTLTHDCTLEFDPASAYAECIHAHIGDDYQACISASDECSSIEDNVDIIRFDWCNLNMHSDLLGMSAVGTTSTMFSLDHDASISLGLISNLEALSSAASWSVELYGSNENLIGSLNDMADSYDLEKDTAYQLVFSMSGSNTLTDNGSMVCWDVAVEYATGGAAVPGAGGLATLMVLASGRRRRRN